MNAILVVNKPKNVTSRDIVNELSHIFQTKKIGHTGTLDPIATGVLVITIGKWTKLTDLLTSYSKEYIASFKLGIKTDTYDITGRIIASKKIDIKEEKIRKTINDFPKKYEQEVPIYSAVKINGKKLYEYAREGKKIKLPKREVTIEKLELLNIKDDIVTIKTTVSKGTYIRSLINDIALKLGTYATMTSLERTKQGEFDINNSYSLEDIKNNKYEFISLEKVLKNYKHVIVDSSLEKKVLNGSLIPKYYDELFVLQNEKKEYLAIYKPYEKDEKLAKPYVMLKDNN